VGVVSRVNGLLSVIPSLPVKACDTYARRIVVLFVRVATFRQPTNARHFRELSRYLLHIWQISLASVRVKHVLFELQLATPR
jgi:hypothetical protein